MNSNLHATDTLRYSLTSIASRCYFTANVSDRRNHTLFLKYAEVAPAHHYVVCDTQACDSTDQRLALARIAADAVNLVEIALGRYTGIGESHVEVSVDIVVLWGRADRGGTKRSMGSKVSVHLVLQYNVAAEN